MAAASAAAAPPPGERRPPHGRRGQTITSGSWPGAG